MPTPPTEIPYGNIITGIVTGVVTLAGVIIANWLALRRSNKERLWDLRRQTYGVMLSELAAIERICDDAAEHIDERGYDEYWSSGSRKGHDAEIAKRMDIVQTRFSDDYLILSDEFIKAYNDLTDAMKTDPYNSLPPEEHEVFSEAIPKHRPHLMALARNEMNIKIKWNWPFT